MALEGAYLYTNQKLHGKPDVRLQRSDHNGEPFVIVDLSGGYSGTYVRVHAAATAAAHMAAFYEAVRLLDPAGASDALLDLIDDDALAKILARAREEDARREALAAPGVTRMADIPPSPGPLCPRCGSPGPLDEAGVCENTGACSRRSCAKCHAEPRSPGGPYGAKCLDMCHEALEFDHVCMICATPEEAKALGFRVVTA